MIEGFDEYLLKIPFIRVWYLYTLLDSFCTDSSTIPDSFSCRHQKLTGIAKTNKPRPPGGRGGYSIYPWVWSCSPAPRTQTLFKTKIADNSFVVITCIVEFFNVHAAAALWEIILSASTIFGVNIGYRQEIKGVSGGVPELLSCIISKVEGVVQWWIPSSWSNQVLNSLRSGPREGNTQGGEEAPSPFLPSRTRDFFLRPK